MPTKVSLSDITIIAELANSHEGDVSQAVENIEGVTEAADVIKIQVFSADDLAVESHPQYELYQRVSLSTTDIETIVGSAHENGLTVFADIVGRDGLDRVTDTAIDGFKIHSSDLANRELIADIAQKDKPTLISAGGASPVEIRTALMAFETASDAEVGLVYGFQNYPTELDESNLNRLKDIIAEFGDDYAVGYATHVDGGTADAKHLPAWAIAAGADFVEVHTTLDRAPEGTDYYSSLEPDAFELMAKNVQRVRTALGGEGLDMSESELEYREEHKKCVVTTRQLDAGEVITEEDVTLKRPEEYRRTAYQDIDEAIGKQMKEEVQDGEPVRTTDVEHTVAATLACRAESTRLYGKPLQLIGEKPILAHQISQLRRVEAIDEIVLAISDTPSQSSFIDFATEHDIEYVVGDEENVLGRIVTACETVDADIAVRVTTENPFIYEKNIDELVEYIISNNADLAVTRKLPLGSYAEVVRAKALRQAHKLGEDRHRSELVTTYITENPGSFDILGVEPPAVLQRPDVRLTVDNPCDLIVTRKIWDHVADRGDEYDLEKILGCYDKHNLGTINEDKRDGESDNVVDLSWHIYGDADGKMTIIDS